MQVVSLTIHEIIKMSTDAEKEMEVCDYMIDFYQKKKQGLMKDLFDFYSTKVSTDK